MDELTIQLTNAKARGIIKELEELHLIRVIDEKSDKPVSISKKLAGKLPHKIADQLQLHLQESRNEWERNI